MCVDPKARGSRIGRRLYQERRSLVERLELNGIVFGGRMPNFSKYRRRVEGPDDYLSKVQSGQITIPCCGSSSPMVSKRPASSAIICRAMPNRAATPC
jgi:hypothetical protein